jgi:hypothetical protein
MEKQNFPLTPNFILEALKLVFCICVLSNLCKTYYEVLKRNRAVNSYFTRRYWQPGYPAFVSGISGVSGVL